MRAVRIIFDLDNKVSTFQPDVDTLDSDEIETLCKLLEKTKYALERWFKDEFQR